MGEGSTIDARMQAALARLTDNEKECLRRRLQQQTAKEMALELGVSPHAVEKRLKMARTKLGLSSSLEAARLLTASEGYQQTGPHAPDLDTPANRSDPRASRWRTLGAVTMGILATILLAYATQTGSVADPTRLSDEESGAPRASQQFVSASATPEQVEEYVKDTFARFDRDGSGFIERSEGPASIDLNCCGARAHDTNGDVLTGDAAWRRFVSDNADDGDNRVSFAEFRGARYERLPEDGIPVPREDVTVVGERPSPYREPQPGAAPGRASVEDFEYVQASPERVRAYVRQMFDTWDVDKSGFVELPEAPVVLITQPARLDEDGKATMDVNAPAKELQGDAARRQYIANVDKDDDGKVSFDEYAEPVMPQFLRRGIPLIPADWRPAAPSRQ
jgi:DNA-binding CsgD family transcriptional regulator/Ca2+-binding EF-hand superfamily protein